MKRFTSESQKTGEVGENVACKFLMKRGFEIVERNYTKKWGELDIVAKKDGKLHFVEVKSVSRENINSIVPHETEGFRPEDNMHPKKQERLARAVETYLLDRNVSSETEWQFDLATVYLDLKNKKAKVNLLEDIVL